MRGWLPESYAVAALSNDVVDLPSVPGFGLYLSECKFEAMESDPKFGVKLDPRRISGADCSIIGTEACACLRVCVRVCERCCVFSRVKNACAQYACICVIA